MEAAGEQLLAGAGLALDQDRHLGLRRLSREVAEIGHFLADIDELLEALAFGEERQAVPPIQHERVAGEFELARQEAVTAGELASLERALDHKAYLLGIEGLAQELVDRRRRQRLPGERGGHVEDEDADDVGMGDAQSGEKAEALAAAVILGEGEIDMDVGQGSLRFGGGADVEHAVSVLRRQMVQRIGPLGRVPRDRKHRSELVHDRSVQSCLTDRIPS